ncbi:MAG: DUF3316 domain-containing protein [Bacteroidaceae bacterium]
MKKVAVLLYFIICVLCPSFSEDGEGLDSIIDSSQAHRYLTRATMYGVGMTNVFDTYLSPLEYTGIEFRVSRETMRMTKLFDGNVSLQNYFQANVSYSENKAETSNSFAGLVNWNCGLHYQFRINNNLKFLTGALGELNGGFIYNLRNSNNPASAKAYVNLSASAMMIYHFRIKHYPMIVRYQANVPFMGVMFSPDHQQSYYEIFTVGERSNIVKFTSLHNQPSIRQMLSLDFPVRYTNLRVSYLWDVQQSHLNGLKTHTYSHLFMVGFVKNLYRIRNKDKKILPPSVRAY